MFIQKLEVEGFRSFRHMTWEPGSLNVVIGPNACGKSNLLGLLEMLSEAASGRFRDYVLKQGGMISLLWDGRAERIRVAIDAPIERLVSHTHEFGHFGYVFEAHGGPIPFGQLLPHGIHIVNERLTHNHPTNQNSENTVFERETEEARVWDSDKGEMVTLDDPLERQELLLSQTHHASTPVFTLYLREWSIFHHFSTVPAAPVRLAQVARYETKLDPDGQNLTAFLHTQYESDGNFRQQVNDAMNAAFGGDFEELVFPPAADQRVQMRIRWKGLKQAQSAAVLSDGTLRFLFLVALLANPKPPALIAIDEPETGLHPSMLPILAEYAVDAASRTQLIFTSHSPEFLNAFSDTVPTTTVMQWNDGQTEVRVLEGESLAYWLDKYQLGELYRDRQLEAMG